jgi:hypothetical protein
MVKAGVPRRSSLADLMDDDELNAMLPADDDGSLLPGSTRSGTCSPRFEGDREGAATHIQSAYRGYRGRKIAKKRGGGNLLSGASSKAHLEIYAALGDESVLFSGPNAELHKVRGWWLGGPCLAPAEPNTKACGVGGGRVRRCGKGWTTLATVCSTDRSSPT